MTGKESAAGGSNSLTDTQMKFLASMMKNSKTKPDVDWDAVAAECGPMTSKSARERYRMMAIKFGWNATQKAGEASSPLGKIPKKAAGVTKRTGRVGTPAKKGKGGKKAAAAAAEESDAEGAGAGAGVMSTSDDQDNDDAGVA